MGAGLAPTARQPGRQDKLVVCLNDCPEKTINSVVNDLYSGLQDETLSYKHTTSLSGLPGCLADRVSTAPI